MDKKKGCLELQQEVMNTDVCTRCGLCVGLCPYIKTVAERVALVHPCGLEEGNCYRICPRTPTNWAELDQEVFQKEREDHELGNYQEIAFARSLQQEVAQKGQYGGVVSALTSFLLEKEMASGAVLAGGPAGEPPFPLVAGIREEVLACAGSRYSAAPTLAALHQAFKEGVKSLVVVGRPCQVLAVRKLQGLEELPGYIGSKDKIAFVIGLFCFWSLETGIYDFIRSKAGGQKVLKVDIPREYLTVTTESEEINIPIDEVRPFIRQTCASCFDPTAEFADISVGSTEYDPGWNTLIVRSARGKELVEAACSAGIIETKLYPSERLPLLREAVRNKKIRVLETREAGAGAGYLELSEGYRGALGKERG